MKRRKRKSRSQINFPTIQRMSLWIAGLIVIGGFIYYFSNGINNSSAFEQLPKSLVYSLADQSGAPQYDRYGLYGVYYVRPGDTVDMWVTVKNLSKNPQGTVWYPRNELANESDMPNAHAVGAGTADDSSPFWLDSSSFVANGNRFAYYNGPAVHRGKYMTLAWRVKVSSSAVLGSTYPLAVKLVREFDENGTRVYGNGKNYPINTIRWAFKITNLDVYTSPVKSISGYSGKLVYENLSNGLTQTLMAYNLNSGAVQTLYQRTRADIYSPSIYSQLADPYQGKFLVVQKTQAGDYGYGDKWLVDMNGSAISLPGLVLQNYNWWDAWFSPDGGSVIWEKYDQPGVDLYNSVAQQFNSFMPRLNLSPWEAYQFSGYYKQAWDPDSTRAYLARCLASDVKECDKGINRLEFDQLIAQPFAAASLEPGWLLNNQNFKTIDFDLETGTAIGATAGVKNKVVQPNSEIRVVNLNSGSVQNIAKSTAGVYQIKKISPDGTWFMYTMRNATGTSDALIGPKDKLVVFLSRIGDIYQPILVTQDIDGIGAVGWSKDNRFVVYTEYTHCTAEGCQSQLKVFDIQNRSVYSPTLPNSSRPIAVI